MTGWTSFVGIGDSFTEGHVRMWSEDRLHLGPYGHRLVASLALDALGEPYESRWREPLSPLPPVSWPAARRADLRWLRRHFAPWTHRRLTGRSSGDSISAKRPKLTPVRADDFGRSM